MVLDQIVVVWNFGHFLKSSIDGGEDCQWFELQGVVAHLAIPHSRVKLEKKHSLKRFFNKTYLSLGKNLFEMSF